MDIDPLQNAALNTVVVHANAKLDAATVEELICAACVPLLALLIGIRVNRYIDRKPHTTMGIKLIDFTAPLLSPVLAMLFSVIAMAVFKAIEAPISILPFVAKLAVAWFAIQVVVLMSSKRTAGWFIALVIIPLTLLHLFGLWDVTVDALSQVKFNIGSAQFNVYLVIKGIMAIVAMQWVASFAVSTTDKRLRRIKVRASNRVLILKIFQFILYSFIFLIGVQMLGISLTALSVFSGALGVGLGFGLQKIASNFISGIILLFEKSVEVDDLIELADGTTGFIRQTYARYTLLELADGREILIPNEEFISQRVITWTHSNRKGRVEIKVSVGYECDIELARELMLNAAKSHPRTIKGQEPVCNLQTFGDNGIELALYFWVVDVTEGRMEPKSAVMLAILKAFRANNITIPYPQREVRVMNTEAPASAPESTIPGVIT